MGLLETKITKISNLRSNLNTLQIHPKFVVYKDALEAENLDQLRTRILGLFKRVDLECVQDLGESTVKFRLVSKGYGLFSQAVKS